MEKIGKLIDDYIKYYKLFGKESRKTILKKILKEIDRICIELEGSEYYFPDYINANAENGYNRLFQIRLSSNRYSEIREYYHLKMLEIITMTIKQKYGVNEDELLELFESSMNIDKDNYKERFCTWTKKFTAPVIAADCEVGILMKLFCIKEIDSSTEKYSNPYWEVLLKVLMTECKILDFLKISNMKLSDEFKEKYISEYYKKVNRESFLSGEDDVNLLLKYIDNTTIKSYLYTIKEQLSEKQFSSLIDKTKLSEIHMIFNGKKKDDDFYYQILYKKLKELYPEDVSSEIINLLIKLPMEYKEKVSIIIEDKDAIMELIKDINKNSVIFDNNIKDSFKLVVYYPELMESIDSFENLDEKKIELLKKLAEIPKLNSSPKSLDELEKILSNSVISFSERNGVRFQPDDSGLGGCFEAYRSIIVVRNNGNVVKLSNYDHYRLVSYMYGLPPFKTDYFYDLIEKANEGYITIITEGSSAYIYFPSEISEKQFESIDNIFDIYGIDDMNASFLMIQSKGKSECNIEENYVIFEGKDDQLLRRSETMGILGKYIEQLENNQNDKKLADEDIEPDI